MISTVHKKVYKYCPLFSGLDVRDAVQPGHVLAVSKDSSLDVGRKAFKLMEKLRTGQQAFTIIEKVEYLSENLS